MRTRQGFPPATAYGPLAQMPKNRHVFDFIYVFSSDPTQRPYYQPLLTDPTEAPYQKTLQKPDPTKLWIPKKVRELEMKDRYL